MPNNKKTKEFTAFFSFADPDRELVECLREMFNALGHKTFFSIKEIGRTGSPEWRKQIIKEIRRSYCFVPVYTRHSIQRPWVLYESGVADSIGLQRLPVRVSSVSISEISENPASGATPLVCDLFNEESLKKFLIGACISRREKLYPEVKRHVEEVLVSNSELVNKIKNLSQTRWVFIAGNTPTDIEKLKKDIPWCNSKEQYEQQLKDFVITLTETLINKKFSVSACPQVESVGVHVIATAARCVANSDSVEHVDYRLGGIHPVDQYTRTGKFSLAEKAIKHWRNHIQSFREKYLQDQEWLVLLGGNEGTREEFTAAKKCRVKVLPVPCFGGAAKELWDEAAPKKMKKECNACALGGVADRECIEQIVEFMKEDSS